MTAIHTREIGRFVTLSLAVASMLWATSGCSVYMAANQPGKKDLSVLGEGTPRNRVIAELGAPVSSEERNGSKVETFAFKQGYSKGAKAGRAFFHGAADVLTLGLWEVIGTPVEAIADGTDMKVEVTYSEHNRVKTSRVIRARESEPVTDEDPVVEDQ